MASYAAVHHTEVIVLSDKHTVHCHVILDNLENHKIVLFCKMLNYKGLLKENSVQEKPTGPGMSKCFKYTVKMLKIYF